MPSGALISGDCNERENSKDNDRGHRNVDETVPSDARGKLDLDLMWTSPGEIVPDRERHTIQSPTFMTTSVWNPSGFHVVKALPKWSKFNADSYINNILVAISDWR
jgi:hypothetical protein